MAVPVTLNSGFYPHSAAEVFEKLLDPAVLDRVMLESGSLEAQVQVSRTAGHATIHITRSFEQDWPALVSALVGKRLSIEEQRVWQQASADSYNGTLQLRGVGLPIEMTATMSLGPDADGVTMLRIDGQVKASVPLIGGAVAGLAAEQISKGIAHESAVISQSFD